MKLIVFIILFSIILVGCKSVKNTGIQNRKPDYNIEFIDYLFTEYGINKPSASVLVIKDGKVEFSKSYGYANIEHNILASPNTNYRIASVTKQFTALAIMMLVDKGKISYETTLTDIFSNYPDYGKNITVRHLLTHRSGLVNYNRFLTDDQTEQMLDKDVLHGLLKTDSAYFPPNSKYAYSNTGYAVLAQIVEKVSGISFAEYMKQNIFKPLKMTTSTILEIDKEIKNRAYGYIVKDTLVIPKDQSLTSAIQGDGGVYTSILDYYKWDQALYSSKLLPQSSIQKAFTNYDENGVSKTYGYGFGWLVDYYQGIKILQHGGSSTGFGSHVIRIPSENISIVIFTNKNKTGQELHNKCKALLSHFGDGKFKMPFEIVLEKEINQNGIDKGIELYNKIKQDTLQYTISKGALFNFGISYINANKNKEALKIFEALQSDYPKYFGGYYGSAVTYNEENNAEQAIHFFEKTMLYCSEKQKWASDHSEKMILELSK